MKEGDRVRHRYLGGEGVVVISETTAPDAYGDHTVALVEWDYKDTKVRTFAPVSSLDVLAE